MAGRQEVIALANVRAFARASAWGSVRVPERTRGTLPIPSKAREPRQCPRERANSPRIGSRKAGDLNKLNIALWVLVRRLTQCRPHQSAAHIWRLQSKLVRKKYCERLAAWFCSTCAVCHCGTKFSHETRRSSLLRATRRLGQFRERIRYKHYSFRTGLGHSIAPYIIR